MKIFINLIICLLLAVPSFAQTASYSDAYRNQEAMETNRRLFQLERATLTKATGAEVDTGTDDGKFVTAKALEDATTIPKEGVWTDYSATSTVVGWSRFIHKRIDVKKIGKLVFVSFYFYGTSNSNIATFTLPYAHKAGSNAVFVVVRTTASAHGLGFVMLDPASSTVSLYVDIGANPWPTSGNKSGRGIFFYESE